MDREGPSTPGTAKVSRGWLWILFALALALRLGVLALNLGHLEPMFLLGDSHSYIEAAESLRNHLAIVDEEGAPTWSRPPGYPLFLAISFVIGIASPTHVVWVVLIHIVLSALIVVMTSRVAGWLGGTSAALAVGIIMAFEPSSIAYSNLIMSETLFTLTVMSAVLVWWRWWQNSSTSSLILFAVLVGLLPLIRPAAVFLPWGIALLILWKAPGPARRGLLALLFIVIALIPSELWSQRNLHYFGTRELEARAPRAKAMFARTIEDMKGVPRPPPSSGGQPWDRSFASDQGLEASEAFEIQNHYFIRTLRAYPLAALKRISLNAMYQLGVPDSKLPSMLLDRTPDYTKGSIAGRLRWLSSLGLLGVYLALGMALSLGGFAAMPWLAMRARRWDAGRRALLALIICLVLYQIALSSFVWHQAERYRVPVIPLLAVMLGSALLTARDRGRRSAEPVWRGER